jgi:hypothetical protein
LFYTNSVASGIRPASGSGLTRIIVGVIPGGTALAFLVQRERDGFLKERIMSKLWKYAALLSGLMMGGCLVIHT